MKILEYPKAVALKPTDVFLLDGPDGTRGITAEKLAEALGAVGDGSGLVENINLGALAETNLLKKGDALLVETTDGNRRCLLKEDLFWNLLEVSDHGGGFSDILHGNYYRHKNLGSVYTDAQKEAIRTATYHDLFVGDYWEIGGYVWDIVDINYFIKTGNAENQILVQHLAIMPRTHLYVYKMNQTNTTSTGYRNSYLFNSGLQIALNIINGAFGEAHILPRTELISYACDSQGNVSSEGFAGTIKVSLPSLYMMFGHGLSGNYLGSTMEAEQLALMRMHPYYTFVRDTACWLRDPVNETNFAATSAFGGFENAAATTGNGVRPVFGLIA